MIDALLPASHAFSAELAAGASPTAAWQRAVEAAEAGAAATATMFPRLGRAAYLGARALDTPDGGGMLCDLGLDTSLNGGLVGGKLRRYHTGVSSSERFAASAQRG